MRYPGRIRFDDGAADLDVLVEVTDTHVRFTSGGESIGSWCLADVVAERLVADEFRLDLAGEVIRFQADDQVNFAYGAVQAMAEGWARFHSKHWVTRSRGVAAARRENEPSRIEEVRQAFQFATEDLDRKTEAVERALQRIAEHEAVPPPPEPEVSPPDPESVVPPPPAEKAAPPPEEGERRDREEIPGRRRSVPVGRLPRLDTMPRPATTRPVPAARPPRPADEAAVEEKRELTRSAYADGRHPAETSGLRASMRSMFSRQKDEHEHSYVESTTAVGITRRVCLECGHVSIGVED